MRILSLFQNKEIRTLLAKVGIKPTKSVSFFLKHFDVKMVLAIPLAPIFVYISKSFTALATSLSPCSSLTLTLPLLMKPLS